MDSISRAKPRYIASKPEMKHTASSAASRYVIGPSMIARPGFSCRYGGLRCRLSVARRAPVRKLPQMRDAAQLQLYRSAVELPARRHHRLTKPQLLRLFQAGPHARRRVDGAR